MAVQHSAANGGERAITFEPWQIAEVRRQLYLDLQNCAEHIAAEADRAAQMAATDDAQTVLGGDLSAFVHRTFADATSLLDLIGWDINGDTARLIEHGQALQEWR